MKGTMFGRNVSIALRLPRKFSRFEEWVLNPLINVLGSTPLISTVTFPDLELESEYVSAVCNLRIYLNLLNLPIRMSKLIFDLPRWK